LNRSRKLACGTIGPGRLPEPEEILDRMVACLSRRDLAGKKMLVTAGPTREDIDPVRFISNPSTGKMGFSIARAAEHRGAKVVLITGPTNLPDLCNVTMVRIRTSEEMADAVFQHMEKSDIIIKAAAVSDYRPREPAKQKIKKEKDEMVLLLQKNQDILKELGRRKKDRILVGFAAETENLKKNALKKLSEKNLDMIVGISSGIPRRFRIRYQQGNVFFRDGMVESLDAMDKDSVSHVILDRLIERILPMKTE
jgi:phosphopantothenoylcysteine decarboxylase/phosphopantothenate--cysteine ligase